MWASSPAISIFVSLRGRPQNEHLSSFLGILRMIQLMIDCHFWQKVSLILKKWPEIVSIVQSVRQIFFRLQNYKKIAQLLRNLASSRSGIAEGAKKSKRGCKTCAPVKKISIWILFITPDQYLVDHTVFFGLFSGHPVIAVGVLFYLFERLFWVIGNNFV